MNLLTSLVEYEEFIYRLQQQFPSIAYSTLLVVRRGVGTLQVRGEIIFSSGVRLIVAERLMLDAGIPADCQLRLRSLAQRGETVLVRFTAAS